MYSPSKTISVKSGNTFSLFCSYFNDDGTTLDVVRIASPRMIEKLVNTVGDIINKR